MIKSIKLNALLNVIRQLCVIIFPIITFPYISRVLGAANYGKVTFTQSIISYFSLIAALGISNYAIREGAALRGKVTELNKFFSEIYILNLISTFIAYILLFLTVVFVNKLHEYSILILILSATILLTTVGVDWIYTVYEDFSYITIRSILTQIVSLFLMFILVRQKDDYVTYAFVLMVSSGAANILNMFHARKYFRFHFCKIKDTFKHLKSVFILFFNNIMISIYINSDTTIIGFMRGDYEVGLYSAVSKLYSVIKNVINAIIVVAIPKASYYINNKENKKYNILINKIINCVITFLFPTVTGLFIESRFIVTLISGDEYAESYIALRFLCVAMFFSLFAAIFTNLVLLPFRQETLILKASTISAFVNIVLNFLFIHYWGYTGAALTTALAEFIVAIICYKKSKRYFELKINVKDCIVCIFGCVGIVCICILSHLLFSYTIFNEFITIIMAVICYFVILLCCKNSLIMDVLQDLKDVLKK